MSNKKKSTIAAAPKLLWPILEVIENNPVIVENMYFLDMAKYIQGNPNFPYCASPEHFKNMISSDPAVENSSFWQSFDHCREAFFLDAYFAKNEYWRMICSRIDELDRAYSSKPQHITFIIQDGGPGVGDEYTVEKTQSRINDELEQLDIDDITIEVCPMPDYIHDRFAMFDSQIWHCGASAIGIHHKLSAMSGPWPDKDKRFKKFLLGLKHTAAISGR